MKQAGENSNSLKMVFRNRPENEKIVRTTAAVFASVLDPTLEEISDFKTAVSEAVTNAMQPLYSTLHTQERSGMGFTFMEAFADEVEVKSVPGKGTTVKLIKIIGKGEECGENL